jgi:hypothetical protein
MNLSGIKQRLLGKPPVLVIIPTVYFLVLIFLKWKLALPIDALWFFLGAIFGIFLLDFAEEFFQVHPSPFRSIVFGTGLAIVGFYIVSSTKEPIAKGLILSLSLTLLLFQYAEWKLNKTLASWYALFIGPVSATVEKIVFMGFVLFFIVESLLFLA